MKDEFEDKPLDQEKHDHETSWNRREHKSPVFLYVLLAVVCLVVAYALSGTVK